jgi:RHS repeat-associated protein
MMGNCYRRTVVSFVVAAIVLCAGGLHAATDRILNRGFQAGSVYSSEGIDHVDLHTGALTSTIPLGIVYKSNGTLAYQFTLVYNSHIWDYYAISVSETSPETNNTLGDWTATALRTAKKINEIRNDAAAPPAAAKSGGIRAAATTIFSYVEAVPSRLANAGLGWMVTLGEMEDGDTYVDVDGSSHDFFTTLHGTQQHPNDQLSGTAYARDGSFLRLRTPGNVDGKPARVVDFPNGVQKRFICLAHCADDRDDRTRPEWVLDQIADPFGNVLYVQRTAKPAAGGTWTWTFIEAAANAAGYVDARTIATADLKEVRRHSMDLVVTASQGLEARALRLAAFGSAQAGYLFEYDDDDIYRDTVNTWARQHNNQADMFAKFNAAGKVDVRLLRRVSIPDAGGQTGANFEFGYAVEDSQLNGDLADKVWGPSFTYKVSSTSGRLLKIKLPTGGGIQYDYAHRSLPFRTSCTVVNEDASGMPLAGIRKRQLVDRNGVAIGRPWLYFSHAFRKLTPPVPPCNVPRELVTGVIEPTGRTTLQFYSAFTILDSPPAGETFRTEEFNLPLSRFELDADQRPLSSSIYQCAAGTFEGVDGADKFRAMLPRFLKDNETVTAGCSLRRNIYRKYEWNGSTCGDTGCQGMVRVQSENTVYFDDVLAGVPRSATTDSSGYDGLGHYRTVTTSGTFDSANFPNRSNRARTTHTSYNGSAAFNPSTFVPPSQWILGTYDRQWVRDPDSNFMTLYDHDPVTGFLRGTRRLADRDPAAGVATTEAPSIPLRAYDAIAIHVRTQGADGLTTVDTRYLGGDKNKGAPTGANFPDPASTTGEYRIARHFRYGALESAAYHSCTAPNAAAFLTLQRNVVDANTGLSSSSTDASNQTTAFDWDLLGRIVQFSPHGSTGASPAVAKTFFKYALGTGDVGALVKEIHGHSDVESAAFQQVRYVFDPHGRVVEQRSLLPSGWMTTVTVLDEMSRVTSESVLVPFTGSDTARAQGSFPGTAYDYDIFGRVTAMRQWGGRVTDYTYAGDRIETEKRQNVGSSSAITTRSYDRHGRLAKITEPSGPSEALAITWYGHDAKDRLLTIESVDGGGGVQQTRTFTYDGRGSLVSEKIPELPGIEIKYSDIDSRGNVGRRKLVSLGPWQEAAVRPFETTHKFDGAERLREVWAHRLLPGDTAPRRLKTFDYGAPASIAADKIVSATRVNWVPDPTALDTSIAYNVVETFAYEPNSGWLDSKTTTMRGRQFTVGYDCSPLGDVARIAYPSLAPACQGTGCVPVPNRAFPQVVSTFNRGFVNGITGYIRNVAYSPSGAWSSFERLRADRTTLWGSDTQVADVQGSHKLPRPRTITMNVTGVGGWSFGLKYGADGNVSEIANDNETETFKYDAAGRLTESGPASSRLLYQYDRFGNMTAGAGATYTLAPPGASVTPSNHVLNWKPAGSSNVLGWNYDAAGNVDAVGMSFNPATGRTFRVDFDYDSFNRQTHATGPIFGRIFVYTASDERVGVIEYKPAADGVRERWSVRGAWNEVLSDFALKNGTWSWEKDYVYFQGRLLASESPNAGGTGTVRRHYHLDHLGTPRRVTEEGKSIVETREYDAFGRSRSGPDTNRLIYTGHERDGADTATPYDDFDAMHARVYNAVMGRFLSVDPLAGVIAHPQSMNRYTYALNAPLTYFDPTGAAVSNGGASVAQGADTTSTTTCDDNGCTTTVTAQDPANEDNYGLNSDKIGKTAGGRRGRDFGPNPMCGMDVCPDDPEVLAESVAHGVMGFADSYGIGDIGTPAGVASRIAEQRGDTDYVRRKALVDRGRPAYIVGEWVGWTTTVVAVLALARVGPAGKPPAGKPPAAEPPPPPGPAIPYSPWKTVPGPM